MRRAARRLGASVFAGLAAATLLLLTASSAAAQTSDSIPAEVRFEIGAFSAANNDWPITAVLLSGGLLDGKRAAVTLEGANGVTLWEGEADFTAPVTRIPVDQLVRVADVVRVSLAQEGFTVATGPVITETPGVTPTPAAVTPAPAAVVPPTEIGPGMAPEVRAQIIERPIPLHKSATVGEAAFRGNSAGPKLAVSLVVLLVVFAIVFRLPLVPMGGQARVRR